MHTLSKFIAATKNYGFAKLAPISMKSVFIKDPIEIVGYPRNLIIYQGRKKTVIPNASTGIYMIPALNPYQPLPPQHRIVRVGKKKGVGIIGKQWSPFCRC